MKLSKLIILLTLLTTTTSYSTCPSFRVLIENFFSLKKPLPIKKTKDPEVYSGEHPQWGKFYPAETSLGSLPDGNYVYIIDNQGNKVISRFDEVDGDECCFLVSHRSLLKELTHHNGVKNPKILAAGQFQISAGRIPWFSNESGTFKGDELNLTWAAEEFKKANLPIEEKTSLDNYARRGGSDTETSFKRNPNVKNHDKDNKVAKLLFLNDKKPELKKLATEFAFLYRKLAKLSPSQRHIGHARYSPITDKFTELEVFNAMSFLKDQEPDIDVVWGLDALLSGIGDFTPEFGPKAAFYMRIEDKTVKKPEQVVEYFRYVVKRAESMFELTDQKTSPTPDHTN